MKNKFLWYIFLGAAITWIYVDLIMPARNPLQHNQFSRAMLCQGYLESIKEEKERYRKNNVTEVEMKRLIRKDFIGYKVHMNNCNYFIKGYDEDPICTTGLKGHSLKDKGKPTTQWTEHPEDQP